MTVRELYEWAKENNVLDMEIRYYVVNEDNSYDARVSFASLKWWIEHYTGKTKPVKEYVSLY